MSEASGKKVSATLLEVDQYFDFIVANSQNSLYINTQYKITETKGIPEIVGNFFLISSYGQLNDDFYSTQVNYSNSNVQNKYPTTIQSKDRKSN